MVGVADLQVRVFEVVVGVNGVEALRARVALLHQLPSRLRGLDVGGDRLLPEAEPREDVRRHVEGVRRIRRDFRVGARCREGLGRELGIVEGVDHVVGHAGVVGLGDQQAVQDRRRLLVVGMGRVVRRLGALDRDRVEDRGLVVVGEALRQSLHRVAIRRGARAVVEPLLVAVERGDRVDVALLPVRLRPEVERPPGRGLARGELGGARRSPDRVVVGHRDAPLRHAARGILRRDLLEREARLLVAEGVEQRDRAREVLRDRRRTGRREVYGAELLAAGSMDVGGRLLSEGVGGGRGENGGKGDANERLHHRFPLSSAELAESAQRDPIESDAAGGA